MLLSPGCAFCPAVLQALGELVKTGVIGRLEVVNIASHPEAARKYGVRSVPWVRIGVFELSDARTQLELERWARRAGSDEGTRDYIADLLKSGGLERVLTLLRDDERNMRHVLALVADPDADLHARIGAGAVLEHLQGTPLLAAQVDALGRLTRHADPRVRADAAHYLSLTLQATALPFLRALEHDADADVREIAREGIAALNLWKP
jgi:hypothetical protein